MGNLFFTKEQLKQIEEKDNKREDSSTKESQAHQENEHDKKQKEWLKNQVENYDTLEFWESARKIASILMIVTVIITLIFMGFSIGSFPYTAWLEVVIVLVLAFFVWKGKRWAMIIAMIYWTLGKGYQIIGGFSAENFYASSIFMPIFWWLVWFGVFKRAYRVEKARAKT